MKNRSVAAAMILCTLFSASVQANLTGTFKTITLDGSLDDWSSPADVLYDDTEIVDGEPTNSTYEAVYLANDAANLYVALDMKGSGGADITNSWRHNIYLDIDSFGGTGFNAGWMSHGYDVLIQYGANGSSYSVHEFSGASPVDWGWTFLGTFSYASSDDVAEFAIPLSLLNLPTNSFVMELSVVEGDVITPTWAHSDEASAETYTLAAFTGDYPVIIVDGSLEEWDNPGHVFYNDAEISDGTPTNTSYENVYVVNDATDLFIGLDMKGSGGAAITNTWTHNIFLDTDMNPATGFNATWMLHGYDHLIQYGIEGGSYSVYAFSGASQADWGWNYLGDITYAYSDDIVEISVPLYLLNLSTNTLVMELNVTGTGVATETWAYQWESGAKTYTLLDNGEAPPLAPIGSVVINGPVSDEMILSWLAAAGQSYQVMYKIDLSDATWLNYTSLVAGSGGEITVTAGVDQVESFYQVVSP